MKSQYFYKSALALAILGLASCKSSVNTTVPTKGAADFTRYIAVGNSLTSGFADNGLYLEGQKNSYPEMVGGQMKTVGGGNFSTPFFPDNQPNGSGHLQLTGFNPNGTPIITQVAPDALRPGTSFLTRYVGDINNYGVPGIKLIHAAVPGYGTANPYYERLLTDQTLLMPYLSFVTSKPFTFFSMWLGNNDILGYASGGGVGDVPTPKATFTAAYNGVIAELIKGGTGGNGAKGVVATIPDVTSTPYFTTVTLASILATVHASSGSAGVTDIYIKPATGTARAATKEDLFVLPLGSKNLVGTPGPLGPYGLSPYNPVENQYVLDKDEVAIVNDYTASYNATIKSVAAAKGLALMDANALLRVYSAGQEVNGAAVSSAFITGNLFSLDGIHLTPMGYAIVANAFIKSINAQYGSSIPTVDVTKYRGVRFPQ